MRDWVEINRQQILCPKTVLFLRFACYIIFVGLAIGDPDEKQIAILNKRTAVPDNHENGKSNTDTENLNYTVEKQVTM